MRRMVLILTVVTMVALLVISAVPAIAQVSQAARNQAESGVVSLSFSVQHLPGP